MHYIMHTIHDVTSTVFTIMGPSGIQHPVGIELPEDPAAVG
jgi:hypothetical protein